MRDPFIRLRSASRALPLTLLLAAPVAPGGTAVPRTVQDGPGGTRVVEVHEGAADPAVSPDGASVALSVLGKIWRVPFGGGEATQVTEGASWDGAPAWSPDGRFLAYAAGLPGGTDLRVHDFDTGTFATVLHVGGTIPALAWMPDGSALYYVDQRGQYEAHLGRARESVRRMGRFVRNAWDAGVPILAGTDDGNLFDEMDDYAAAGLPNAAILRAATANGALWLGQEEEFGTLEPGRRGDFVLVDGDPLAEISDARKVRLVAQGGRVVFRR